MEPIERADQLPKSRRTNERAGLDFKAVPTNDPWTIASDVAAMANAEGGTILVGVHARGEYLQKYAPLSRKDASATQLTYEQAVKNRCRPAPLVSVIPIPMKRGVVLAVNVSPFPGQLVGAEVKQGEAKCGSKPTQPQGLYYFPRRVGAHTVPILPEQMPMFMDARARRTALLLAEARGKLAIATPIKGSRGARNTKAIRLEAITVVDVDFLGNSATFDVPRGDGKTPQDGTIERMSIPLECIEAVGRAGDTWHIILRGWFEHLVWSPNLVRPELEKIKLLFVREK